MEKLKRCPAGHRAQVEQFEGLTSDLGPLFGCSCTDIGCLWGLYDRFLSEDEAIAAWNLRSVDPVEPDLRKRCAIYCGSVYEFNLRIEDMHALGRRLESFQCAGSQGEGGVHVVAVFVQEVDG